MNDNHKFTPIGAPETPEEYKLRMYNFSDPKRMGRGAWTVFMVGSLHARNQADRDAKCHDIRMFCEFFKCLDCHGHCTKYIENDPPEPHSDTNLRLFQWVVTFMSAVNIRIGKPAYDSKLLEEIFTNETMAVCDKGCGEKEEMAKIESPKKPIPDRIYFTAGKEDMKRYKEIAKRFPGLVKPARVTEQKPVGLLPNSAFP